MEICKEMIKLRKGLDESGLLECMSNAVDESGEPKGSMTADEILEVIDGLKV